MEDGGEEATGVHHHGRSLTKADMSTTAPKGPTHKPPKLTLSLCYMTIFEETNQPLGDKLIALEKSLLSLKGQQFVLI